jgi:two-component system sensor histidine kinase ChvG
VKLRAQLIVVSLFALFLPWAGCSFVYEMESVLRVGQQDALAVLAESVALVIEDRGVGQGLAEPDVPDAGQPVYFLSGERVPAIDGYAEGEPVYQSFAEASGLDGSRSVGFKGIVTAAQVYIFIQVEDPGIRYRNPASGEVADGDHVLIATGPANEVRRYWLAPEAPGEFLARYRVDGQVKTEPRIRAVWRDTESGYQIEARLPRVMVGQQFGFAAVDGEKRGRWTGSMSPDAQPGPLIRTEPELRDLLDTFAVDNLRLTVVDAEGWVRARSGALNYADAAQDQVPPGGWMLQAVYRWLMRGDSAIQTLAPDSESSTRVMRAEVTGALAGQREARWYGVEGRRGVAVVAVALPLVNNDVATGVLLVEQSASRILSLTNAAVTRLLFLTLVATFCISFGLVLYASLLSLRIRRLGRRVAAALSEDGRIVSGFPEQWAGDEIGDLGRHFGRLLGRMREYNEYLRTLASKLSHELRTPLAVVGSSLDNLEQDTGSESSGLYIARAREGVARLSRILTAMSEASRVEQSIRSAQREQVDLTALIKGSVAGYREAFDRPIECSVPTEPMVVDGSPDLLAQMLDKLMDNAADFAPAGGRIAFSLHQDVSHAVLAVENEGPPLPTEMRGELFESMVSLRPAGHTGAHLGLGLAIVRLVVEFHHGTVQAGNLADDAGARFRVILPI